MNPPIENQFNKPINPSEEGLVISEFHQDTGYWNWSTSQPQQTLFEFRLNPFQYKRRIYASAIYVDALNVLKFPLVDVVFFRNGQVVYRIPVFYYLTTHDDRLGLTFSPNDCQMHNALQAVSGGYTQNLAGFDAKIIADLARYELSDFEIAPEAEPQSYFIFTGGFAIHSEVPD